MVILVRVSDESYDKHEALEDEGIHPPDLKLAPSPNLLAVTRSGFTCVADPISSIRRSALIRIEIEPGDPGSLEL